MASELLHWPILAGAVGNITRTIRYYKTMEELTLLVATVALRQFIATVFTLFNDVPTAHGTRMDET